MATKSLNFGEKFKNIFFDLITLYKNFIHWNISKCLIAMSTFLLGVVLSIPFIIVMIILFIIDPISWIEILGYIGSSEAVAIEVLSQLLEHPFYVILEVLLFFIACLMFLVGSSYGMVLKTKIYFGYIRGTITPYFGNYYFNRSIIVQYLRVFFRAFLYLTLPFLICLGIFVILYIIYYLGIIDLNMLSKISLGFFILSLIGFLYISYRVAFVYMLMIDKKDVLQLDLPKQIVHSSFEITKGKTILQFLLLIVLFGLVFMPYTLMGDSIAQKGSDSKTYLGYKTEQIPIETEDAQIDFQMLSKQFEGQSDDEIIDDIVLLGRINLLYVVFGFLFVEGVFQMLLVSFYLQFLSQKTQKKGVLGKLKKVFHREENTAKKVAKTKTKRGIKKKEL